MDALVLFFLKKNGDIHDRNDGVVVVHDSHRASKVWNNRTAILFRVPKKDVAHTIISFDRSG